MSLLHSEFTLMRLGFLIEGNHLETVPVPNWKLNDFIFQSVKAKLEPRFQVSQISFDRNQFSADRELHFGLLATPFDQAMRKAIKSRNVDMILVFDNADLNVNQESDWPAPVGMMKNDGIVRRASLFVTFNVLLVDGKTYKVMETQTAGEELPPWRVGRSPLDLLTTDPKFSKQNVETTDALWADKFSQLTLPQKTELEVRLKRMVNDSIAEALPRLGLRQ